MDEDRELLMELSMSPKMGPESRITLAIYLHQMLSDPRGNALYDTVINDRRLHVYDRLEAAFSLGYFDPAAVAEGISRIAADTSIEPAFLVQMIKRLNREDAKSIYQSIILDPSIADVYRICALP